MKSLITILTILFLCPIIRAQEIFQKPEGVQTRWASPENPMAKKGRGGLENYGRKGRAHVNLLPGDTLTLAYEPEGISGTIRRI